jgi:ATP-dependent helicase/nuclease subunit B
VITPRRTTLTAAPGLRSLHRAIADASRSADPTLARATVVLVPTRAAASQLRRTLENQWLLHPSGASPSRAALFPEILTRTDWYRRFDPLVGPRRLSEIERETLLSAAARDAARAGTAPPFRLRPGLVAGMLGFYDALGRQQKTVADFERLVLEDLEPRAEFDRGAERLLRQTRFLAAAFRGFEQRMAASGGIDEHLVRQRALDSDDDHGIRRVIVATGDRASDPSGGLYAADFDFLARLPRLESIEIVATRALLLAGLAERIRSLMPGIDEQSAAADEESPALVVPPGESASLYRLGRDREEELREIARQVKAERAEPGHVAVVFRRPLPYVYLATTVFDSARVAYQAADALPLAAEPFAAALDLVVAAVANRFARGPLVQLLRSPHFAFTHEGAEPGGRAIEALDRALAETGYLGDADRLAGFAESAAGPAAVAARAAVAAVREVEPLGARAPVSVHLATLLAFIRGHERLDASAEAGGTRHLRARTAVIRVLEEMRSAALAHDDPPVRLRDLSAWVRRWLEAQTFTPTRGGEGLQLADAQSARYGDFDRVHLAGLVAGDWPESSARNIFYPAFLLSRLGWPSETDRLAAERAAFADLLRLARRRVSVSSFQLEDDAIVEPSPLLDEIERAALPTMKGEAVGDLRVFADEALSAEPLDFAPLDGEASEWAKLRSARSPAAQPQFHGHAADEGTGPARGFTVTGIDRYLECPFKYFAATVLGLPEDAIDEPAMSPRERGRFVHEVFQSFFAEWQARGGGAITTSCLDAARTVFADVAEASLGRLPAAEAALERMRLLGSVAAPGLGEVALAVEAVRPTPVVERLLEYPFEGEFTFGAGGEYRTVRLRGKADRIDLLANGEFRVIDYKIGRAPEDSVQLPVYATCLTQQFEAQGRSRQVGEALYIAFGDRDRAAKAVIDGADEAPAVLAAAHQRVIDAIDGIGRGEFPPRPASARSCTYCAYAAVCRKDCPAE